MIWLTASRLITRKGSALRSDDILRDRGSRSGLCNTGYWLTLGRAFPASTVGRAHHPAVLLLRVLAVCLAPDPIPVPDRRAALPGHAGAGDAAGGGGRVAQPS